MIVPPRSKLKISLLALAAIYAPYLLLFLSGDARDNLTTILAIWAIFPGLSLTALIPPAGLLDKFRGMGTTILMTFVWVAVSFLSAWRFRSRLWIPLAVIVLGSLGLVYVMLLLLRA